MPNTVNDLYAFDQFELDTAERRLLHRGLDVPLPEKAFETLCVLVKSSNRLVTRETLLREVWKDTIVEENNLAKNVSLLRKVLRLQADGRDFIETVRGHGFRFTGDVRVLSTAGAGQAGVGQEGTPAARQQPRERTRWSWPMRVVVGGLLGMTLLLSYSLSSPKPAAAEITSIAVLPFDNAGVKTELAYLSDGLSEGLIDALAALPHLKKVSSRYSSFRYRGKNLNIREAAKELGVEGIITGTVVQRGNALFIRAELTDARSNSHVWGEDYTRSVPDVLGVLDVQREIARAVAGKLRLTPAGEQVRRQYLEYTPTPEAYENLQRGRAERQKGTPASHHQKAIEYFTRATEADPNYALALAELSLSYSIGLGVPDLKVAMSRAEAAAARALQIDDSLAEAHHSMGNVKLNRLDWAGAELEFTRAIELNPKLARAHAGYSNVLSVLGEHERAIAHSRKAMELDPLLPRANVQLGGTLLAAGRPDQAIELFMKATLHRNANLGSAYCAKRMYREAVAEFVQAIKIDGTNPSAQIYLGAAYAKAGETRKARAILRELETTTAYVSPVERAVLLNALGDRDAAFASLNQGLTERDAQLQSLKIEIFFEDIRNDPRFHELLRQVGLPQ